MVVTATIDSSVVFDTSILLLFLDRNANPPIDPNTKKQVVGAHQRIRSLVKCLQDEGEQILIPATVLAELMVYTGEATLSYLNMLEEESVFCIVPFDRFMASECARLEKGSLIRGREDPSNVATLASTRARMKLDRQIVATAIVKNARAIYTDDVRMNNFIGLENLDLAVYGTVDIPLPKGNF